MGLVTRESCSTTLVNYSGILGNNTKDSIERHSRLMESEQSLAFKKYMNSLPPALLPVYTTEQPNQPILLYEGSLEITQEINQHPIHIEGHGKVEYVWFPYPCIKFQFSNQSFIDLIDFNNNSTLLTLSDTNSP